MGVCYFSLRAELYVNVWENIQLFSLIDNTKICELHVGLLRRTYHGASTIMPTFGVNADPHKSISVSGRLIILGVCLLRTTVNFF